jgi:hypothetical protein
MKRILLAGLLGGIAMFAWTSIAHMVLPLGTIGIREIPNEPPVLSALQTSIAGTSGMYLFPGMGLGPNPSMKEMNAAMPEYQKKLASMPSGILIYHPPGRPPMTGGQLGGEFANEFVGVLLAAFLLSLTRLSGYGARVGFIAVIGVLASLPTNISYWLWYGFPGNYTAANMCIQIVGFLAAGLVAGAMIKPARALAGAAAA